MSVDLLATYVPMDRRHELACGVLIPDRGDGSVLLADISGFTPMTEALVERFGPRRGAEELTALLNDVYTSLVACVHRYGGSVVCFIGDALIACFDDDAGGRSVACAQAMQDAMGSFEAVRTPDGQELSLGMKAAVEAGAVRRFLVGDPKIRRIDVLAGGTVDRLTNAEHLAERGEIVVGPHLIERLRGELTISELRGPFGVAADLARELPTCPRAAPDVAALGAEALRPLILPEVYRRIEGGQGAFLAELRPIAALFLRFEGIEYDADDAAGEKLDAFTTWVQHVVHRLGGHVLLLTTADKGSHLYAAFGALEAHEDDAERAVVAAMELLDVPPSLGFVQGLRIGVSQGRVYVGGYGGAARRTYGALGETVNLAARLMGVSPAGEIRCSEGIHASTAGRINYERHPDVTLKGMRRPQAVFRPTGARLARDVETVAGGLIGRQGEVAALRDALERANAGERQVVLLEGEAGIGKSRLIAELRRIAAQAETTWLAGAGSSIEQHAPYRAWREPVSSLLDVPTDAPAEALSEHATKTLRAIDASFAERAPLLDDVLGLDVPETALTRSYTPELRREGIASLIGDLLRRRAGASTLILVLDDVHWMDSLSWDLALSVVRSLIDCSALVVLSHRPLAEPVPRPFRILTDLPDTARLCLGSLPPEETVSLAEMRLGLPAGGLPAEVADLLTERAEGNPFYALEMIGALTDQGLLHVTGEACTLEGDASTVRERIPDTLEGVVLSRIDQLSDEGQLMLKVASAVGRSFLFRILRDVHPSRIDSGDLRRELDETGRRQLTELEAEEPERAYAFHHAVTQHVAYETLLFEQRRSLHRAIAGWIESSYRDSLSPHIPLLALHWRRAGNSMKELEYARRAGNQAAEQYANEEALDAYDRVIELIEELNSDPASDARLEALRKRVGLLATLGRVEEEQRDLETLRSVCQSKDDACRAEVDLLWSDFHRRGGRFTEAIEEAKRALARWQELGNGDGAARALVCIGSGYEGLGQFAEARRHVEEAVAHFRGTGELTGAAGEAIRSLGIIAARLGEFPQAMERFGEAHELFRARGDRKGEAEICGNLGAVGYYFGEYETCIANSRKAEQIFREMGNRAGTAKCLANVGSAYRDLGAFSRALDVHQQAFEIFRQLDDANECAGSTYNIACDLQALGVGGYPSLSLVAGAQSQELRRAIAGFEEALERYSEIGSQWGKVLCNLRLGSAWLNAGDVDSAEPYLRVALDLSREVGMASQEMQVLSALSRVMLQRGDSSAALALSDETMEKLGDSSPPAADELHFTRSRVLRANNRAAEARPHLEHARKCVLDQAESIRDPELREGLLAACHEILTAWEAPPPSGS